MVATASATGVETGAGDDQILNRAAADIDAVSHATVDGDSLAPIGAGGATGRVTADATAWGARTGDGIAALRSHLAALATA